MRRLLVINPGSTSTKVAVYDEEQPLFVDTLRHSSEEIGAFSHILDQYDYRLDLVLGLLSKWKVPVASFSAVVGRGDYCGRYPAAPTRSTTE